MSDQMRLWGSPEPTSSQESEDGISPSDLRGGPSIEKSGQVHALASHFHKPVKGKAWKTKGTSGLYFIGSLRSAALQSSLESRLLQRLEDFGSLEYVLTWKHWDMPSGPPICALRASTRRTSGKGCGGWPTPNTKDQGRRNQMRPHRTENGWAPSYLTEAVLMLPAGWSTPTAQNHSRGVKPPRPQDTGVPLSQQVAGWTSPTAMDTVDRKKPLRPSRIETGRTTGYLSEQVHGMILSGPPASTEKPGALNPDLPRWLMGYPPEWAKYAPTEMPSSRK